jgi:hypothetical protein
VQISTCQDLIVINTPLSVREPSFWRPALNVINPASLVLSERRLSPRTRFISVAKLIYGDFNKIVVDCVIRDISEGGVRVETGIMMPVPEVMRLQVGGRSERNVRRCWALGHAIGLEFL